MEESTDLPDINDLMFPKDPGPQLNEYELVTMPPRLPRTYSKFALKGQPLSGYRTGDSFYYKEYKEQKVKLNTRAIVCVLLATFLLSCLIVAVLYGANPAPFTPPALTYDHTMVGVSLPTGPLCSFTRNCTKYCDTVYLEHLTGCCWGCGIADTCSFPVTVNWTDVLPKVGRLRVWLFVTLDGNFFFQSGNAPIVTNSSGSAIVGDGCFGEIGHPMILISCLSDQNLENLSYEGFPASHCYSTFGICATSGDALVDPLTSCLPDSQWLGNTYLNSWPGPLFSPASAIKPFLMGILLLALWM